MPVASFGGLRVLSLESRRAQEMAKLITNCGGQPTVAPSMREVPLESNTDALTFAASLMEDRLDMVIFMTGVGTRTLARVIETAHPIEKFVAALKRVAVVARGPKPVAVLRELGVPISLIVPEPNTWRELLQALDAQSETLPLAGRRVAVQEYGESNMEFLRGLAQRGGAVTTVPVYQWMPAEDPEPLRAAARTLASGEMDVVLFTSSAQLRYLLQTAEALEIREQVLRALDRVVIASIGPLMSEELKEHGIHVDMEPSHPKMGFLVQEAAQKSAELLQMKRSQTKA